LKTSIFILILDPSNPDTWVSILFGVRNQDFSLFFINGDSSL